MAAAKEGDKVRVHYTGKLTGGDIFDTSREVGEPIEFTLGEPNIIPGFSSAIMGMIPGEAKTITIVSDDAYGPHLEQLVSDIDKKHLPEDLPLEIGQHLEISEKEEKTPIIVTITKIELVEIS